VLSNVTVTAINTLDTTQQYTTITDGKGIFSLPQLKPGASYHFRFSYVGYTPYNVNNFLIREGENNSIMVRLQPALKGLDEVVLVGYGTQKKINLSGAVQQVAGDDLRDRPVTNMTSLLQ
ncbi:carboxypeptidase regulatory-like domain-containing protein, partial [Flavihumibacter sediminis]|nr:carboxypeptidase regulatory-like domain-containing protein [Flavihumibacter sediminis]